MQQAPQVQKEQITLPTGSIVHNVNGDRYSVENLLGKGGSGAVYLVQDKRNKQDYFALKELIDPDKIERDRFAFEAEVLMRLDHESLPHVYRVFENERLKRVYILMDYIEGHDLEALRKEQPNQRFQLHFVLALLSPIVSALSYLHHREPPIVHRDIKPANIVVPVKGGDALLVDFGIAKEYTNDGTTTVIRHGTPGYAALEQYGGGTNIRTDVYGLGATLYTLLTGTIPVDALTRVTGNQGVDPLQPAHELVPSLPLGVSEAISRAMSTARNDRFATISEFWAEVNVQAKEARITTVNVVNAVASTPNTSDVTNSTRLENTTTNSLADENDTTDKLVRSSSRDARVKKNITPMTLAEQRQIAQRERRRKTIYAVLGVFILLLALSATITTFIARIPHPVVSRATSVVTHIVPTATPTLDQAPYPTLSTDYRGTMHDYLNGNAVNSSLSTIQQNKGKIQGSCNCLGLTGPFTGNVGVDGSITFTVEMAGRGTSMLFQGHIKTGGDMAGQFYIINASNGQHTGEYGDWSFK
jgi:serine/threonine protein kinase